jgi:molybdopterin-guanine dinucleotide biosynthesis protein A
MKGIVLCGGQSLRMGRDKGLLIGSKKITWAQQAFSLLSKLDISVALSINKAQYPIYKRVFISQQLVPDAREFTMKGPLLGILTAHLEYPKEDLLVLACDMIEMNVEILQRLQQAYGQQPLYDAYIFKDKNTVEPLCAIYTAKGLKRIADKNKKGELEKFSLMYILDQMNVLNLSIKPDWKKSFSNMNTVSDLQAVR